MDEYELTVWGLLAMPRVTLALFLCPYLLFTFDFAMSFNDANMTFMALNIYTAGVCAWVVLGDRTLTRYSAVWTCSKLVTFWLWVLCRIAKARFLESAHLWWITVMVLSLSELMLLLYTFITFLMKKSN